MIPLDVFGSKSVAADLHQQVHWHDGATYPCCRSDRTGKNGSYRALQRYLCTDCDRTFNVKTRTILAHSRIALRRWLFFIYAFLRFNSSRRQLQCKIEVTHKTIHRRIKRAGEELNAPSLDLIDPEKLLNTSVAKLGEIRTSF